MALLTSSPVVDVAIGVLTLFLLLALYFEEKYKYWKKRGVLYVKPRLFFGNFKDNFLGKERMVETHTKIYEELKREGARFGGFYEMYVPNLMILDPDLISRILSKDFAHFVDRGMFPVNIENDPLSNNVSSVEGQHWRTLRHKQSPVFSTGKLKGMFEQIYNCGGHLLKRLDNYAESGADFETKEILNIFTLDVVASCAFGLQFDFNSPQGKVFQKMTNTALPQTRTTILLNMLNYFYSNAYKLFRLRAFSKEVTEYFLNLSKETVQFRKKSGMKRNDFLQMLLDVKERGESSSKVADEEEESDEDKVLNNLKYSSINDVQEKETKVMTDECLAASSFMFLLAGSEVSSMSFMLHFLAKYPAVQRRLQQEVDEVLAHHGVFNYQSVKDMTYMDQFIQESLRMWPSGGFLTRVCTAPYQLPGTDVVLEKGSRITIPQWAIHHDPQYHPHPEVFDPDRFVGNNYKPTPTYFPFGDGPRICIAMRFAILEVKICIARVMSRFTVRPSSKTQEPIQLDKNTITARPIGGLWIQVYRRK